MVRFTSKKNTNAFGPRSSAGIMSFNDKHKSLIKITPELVFVAAIVLGAVVIGLNYMY